MSARTRRTTRRGSYARGPRALAQTAVGMRGFFGAAASPGRKKSNRTGSSVPPGAFTARSEGGVAALLRTPDATGTRRPLHRRTRSALRRAAVPHARLRLAWDARTLSGPKARLRRAYWEPSRRVVSTRAAKPTRSSNPGCQLTVDREVPGGSAALNCSPKARISDPIGSVVPREAQPSMWDSSAAKCAACYTVKAPATLRTVRGVEEGGEAVLRLRRKCTRRWEPSLTVGLLPPRRSRGAKKTAHPACAWK